MGKEPSAASEAIKEKRGQLLDDEPLKLPFKLPSLRRKKARDEPREIRDRGDQAFERIVGIGVIGLLSTFLAVAFDEPLYAAVALPSVALLFYATRKVRQ